jgi:hypothetical protein
MLWQSQSRHVAIKMRMRDTGFEPVTPTVSR